MNVPKLRFKDDGREFPEWHAKKIGDFVTSHKGGAPLKPSDFIKEGSFEVIPKKAIASGGHLNLDKTEPTYCTADFFEKNQRSVVDKNYLITTLRDLVPSGPSIGYIVKFNNDKKYILAQGVYGIKISDDLLDEFLIQYSNTDNYRVLMQTMMVGSTQVHIRNSDFFQTRFCVPCLDEQTKIANFLTAVDEKISQLTQKSDLLTQYKKGVMQQIFSQELRFKDDDGREFPEWKTVRFGEIFSFKTTNSYSRECLNYVSGAVKNIHYGDIHTKFKSRFNINNERVPFINENIDLSKLNPDCICVEGDLVIADASEDYKDIGKCIEIDNLDNQTVIAGLHTFLARPSSGVLSRGFMSHAMQSEKIRLQIMTIAQGTKVLSISTGRLSKIGIPLPEKEEQTKIANFLTAIDNKITQTQAELVAVERYKKGLLQQLFI